MKKKKDSYEDVFVVLCRTAEAIHALLRGSCCRTGEKEKGPPEGLAAHKENCIRPMFERMLKCVLKSSVNSVKSSSNSSEQNDLTIEFKDGRDRLWLEFKTPWTIPPTKGVAERFELKEWERYPLSWCKPDRKQLPDAVKKLTKVEPPCGLLVLACSPYPDSKHLNSKPLTDALVEYAARPDPAVPWDYWQTTDWIETVATEGLGCWKGRTKRWDFRLAKVYLYLRLDPWPKGARQ
ncbi:MAG: hypothetical protein HYY21_02120 [Candidatus Tectomicrobia bacterium]|nr:hypothetical protein [Candidatus Tectomicrobia bacterium]